jgi:crotonobetainyl-CoA:carnitine CoA-transferase CaiB-like acyl-CoA transferase
LSDSADRKSAGRLAGTRVVEITKYVQGRIAALLLASLGVEVDGW